MIKYIYQGQVMTYEHDITGLVEMSTDYNCQQMAHVELSAEQSKFHANNPNATVREVWDMQLHHEPQISPDKQREQAYENEPVIMLDGKLRTCDFIRGLISTYELLSDTERVEQLFVLWLAGREEIKTKYPDVENL